MDDLKDFLDEIKKQINLENMGNSIEIALKKVENSREYLLISANDKFAAKTALQNLEHEAIYKQAYIEGLLYLIKLKMTE